MGSFSAVWDTLKLPVYFLEGTLDLALKFIETWPMYAFLYVSGWVILGLRFLAMTAPAVMDVIYFALFSLVEVVLILVNISCTISNIATFGHGCKAPDPFPSKNDFFGGVFDAINDAGQECQAFEDWYTVLRFYLGQATGASLCNFLRFVSPSPLLSELFGGALGWLTVDPDPTGNNCETTTDDWLCAILGTGFLIFELLIPLLLAAQILSSYRSFLAKLFYFVLDVLEFAVRVVYHFIRGERAYFRRFADHIERRAAARRGR
jgi:hypothetical protein